MRLRRLWDLGLKTHKASRPLQIPHGPGGPEHCPNQPNTTLRLLIVTFVFRFLQPSHAFEVLDLGKEVLVDDLCRFGPGGRFGGMECELTSLLSDVAFSCVTVFVPVGSRRSIACSLFARGRPYNESVG